MVEPSSPFRLAPPPAPNSSVLQPVDTEVVVVDIPKPQHANNASSTPSASPQHAALSRVEDDESGDEEFLLGNSSVGVRQCDPSSPMSIKHMSMDVDGSDSEREGGSPPGPSRRMPIAYPQREEGSPACPIQAVGKDPLTPSRGSPSSIDLDSADFKVADSPTPPRPEAPLSAGQEYQILGEPPIPPAAPSSSSSCAPLSEKIDDFFKDQSRWEQVFSEVARSPQLRKSLGVLQVCRNRITYIVDVPPGYPGLQYRRSPDFSDRWPRYALRGALVRGWEEDGGWLRVADRVFLPLSVKGTRVLVRCKPPRGEDDACSVPSEGPRKPPRRSLSGLRDTSISSVSQIPDQRSHVDIGDENCDASYATDAMSDVDVAVAEVPAVEGTALPLMTLPAAPSKLPARAPSGDPAADAAEKLLAKVVDPFGEEEPLRVHWRTAPASFETTQAVAVKIY